MNKKIMYPKLNKTTVIVSLAIGSALTGCANTNQDNNDQAALQLKAQNMVSKMSTDEKLNVLVGPGYGDKGVNAGPEVKGTAGYINGVNNPVSGIDLTASVLADGPAGIRIDPKREGDEHTDYATAFPMGVLLASSWDPQVVRTVGDAIGQEAKAYGVDFWLAPGMNIQRNPLNGRNFEYYSEDPFVTAKIAEAVTEGAQSNGIGVTIKHFVANNSETNRMTVNNIISPRALREIYLRGFENTVETAQPWAIMTSYNKVNGTYTSQRHDLVTDVLRDEWGFKGLVMSDWYAGDNAVEMINAGNDEIQPGGINMVTKEKQLQHLQKAYQEGKITDETINRNAVHIVTQMLKTPSAQHVLPANNPDLATHAALSRYAADQGIILLKNQSQALPISAHEKVATFGIAQQLTQKGGTGSGDVHSAHVVNLMEGLQAELTVDPTLQRYYQHWYHTNRTKTSDKFNISTIYHCPEPTLSAKQINTAAKDDDVAVITISRTAGEGTDRTTKKGDYQLTNNESALISKVSNAFHAQGKQVVVVLNISGVIETTSWKDKVDGIVLAYLPGEESGFAVADILSGKTNPSGKLTQTFPAKYSDVPSAKTFFGKDTNGDGKIDTNYYNDGILVGYRYYSTNNVPVSFPFGYGLSYTSFSYGTPTVVENSLNASGAKGEVSLSATITNSGQVAGKEVAEVYIAAPNGKLVKPKIELKSFAKTAQLAPGEAQTLNFTIPAKWLASFDSKDNQWIIEPGQYQAYVAPSANINGIHPVPFTISQEVVVAKTTPNALALPQGYTINKTGGVITH